MARQEAHWAVEVRFEGEIILTIDSNGLSVISHFTHEKEEVIREAGESLLGFIGRRKQVDA